MFRLKLHVSLLVFKLKFILRGSIVVNISACHAEDPGSILAAEFRRLRAHQWSTRAGQKLSRSTCGVVAITSA